MAALSDVFVRVKPDTTGLPAELAADVNAAAARVNARINVKAKVEIEKEVLKAELAKMRAQLQATGDVTLRPKIKAAARDLAELQGDIKGAMTLGTAGFTAALAAGATAAAPLIGAAVAGGIGLAGIGAGIALAIQDPATKNSVLILGSEIKAQLVEAAIPFRAALVESVQTVGNALQGVMPQIQQAFATLAPVLSQLAGGLGGFLTGVMPGFIEGVQLASSLLGQLAGELPSLGAVVGGFFSMLNDHADDIKAGLLFTMTLLKVAVQDLGIVLGGLMNIAGPVLELFGKSETNMKELVGTVISLYGAFKTFGLVSALLGPAIVALSAAFAELGIAENLAAGPIVGVIAAGTALGVFLYAHHQLTKQSTEAQEAFNFAVTETPPPLQQTASNLADVNELMREFGLNASQATALLVTQGNNLVTATDTMLDYRDAQQAVIDRGTALSKSISDANDAVGQAKKAVSDANQSEADAEYNLSKAQDAQKDAQNALTQARKDAAKQLIDLRDAALQAGDAEESSYEKLTAAQARVANGDTSREALGALLAAQNDHTVAIDKNKEAHDSYSDAQKKGIEGSDQVVAAKKRIEDANHAEEAAERAVTKAKDAQKDANKRLAKSTDDLRIAKQKLSDWETKDLKTQEGREHQRLLDREKAAKEKAYPPTAGVLYDLWKNDPNHQEYQHYVPGPNGNGPESTKNMPKGPGGQTQLGPSDTGTDTSRWTNFWNGGDVMGKDSAWDRYWNHGGAKEDVKDVSSWIWKRIKKNFDPTPPDEVTGATKHGTKGNAVSFAFTLDGKSTADSSSTWGKFTAGLSSVFKTNFGNGVKDFLTKSTPSFFANLKDNLPTFSGFTSSVNSLFNSNFSNPVSSFFSKAVPSLFKGLGTDVGGAWDGITSKSQTSAGVVAGIVNGALAALNAVGQPFGVSVKSLDLPGSGGAAQPVQRKASGGPISGPGTTTSDSIPALLSNKEWVINAEASEHYGSQFMHALNSKRIPKLAAGGSIDEIIEVMKKAPASIKVDGEWNRYTNPAGYHGRPHGNTGGFHDISEAVDFNGPNEHAIGEWWLQNWGQKLKELIHNEHGGAGQFVKNGKVVSPYSLADDDHVHVAALPGFSGSSGGFAVTDPGGTGTIAGASAALTPYLTQLKGQNFLGGVASGVLNQIASGMDTSAGASAGSSGGFDAVAKGAYQLYAKSLLKGHGWNDAQFGPLQKLWDGESGWNPHAQNPSSTAYGIAQFLNSTWGGYDNIKKTSDPQQQIRAGLNYVQGRYGTPANALDKWQGRSPHWYDEGGWLTNDKIAVSGTKPEAVLDPEESENFKKLVQSNGKGGNKEFHFHVHGNINTPVSGEVLMKQFEFMARRL